MSLQHRRLPRHSTGDGAAIWLLAALLSFGAATSARAEDEEAEAEDRAASRSTAS
jgi:hypothetical protein